MENFSKFKEFRKQYPEFIYRSYEYYIDGDINVTYHFEIPSLIKFNPTMTISKNTIKIDYNKEMLEYLIFQIGLIELISYVKCTCSKNIIIEAGYIDERQIKFLKKLYYNGLGELLYTNGINVSEEELFNITCICKVKQLPIIENITSGNLICVGGGKDSCVSLELLKNEKDNACLVINPKAPTIGCCNKAGYKEEDVYIVKRNIDRTIVELNNKGFLNGHTPLSAAIAFISYLCAYLSGKKNIVLSNEASANQATVLGTTINHQYSKTYEFEKDFREYITATTKLDINYFSLLRGLSEYNIAKLFSNYHKYFDVFKSCNLGSKEKDWKWCCNCPKCLFIYIILSPFISLDERIKIFGEDLYDREDLLKTFIEIVGYSDTKPFECVGTYEEARLAVSQVINKGLENSFLLKYYKEHYSLELDATDIEKYNNTNSLNEYYNNLVKEELKKYDK